MKSTMHFESLRKRFMLHRIRLAITQDSISKIGGEGETVARSQQKTQKHFSR
jgi:hypothetical protein